MGANIIPYSPSKPARYRRSMLGRALPDLPDYLTPDEVHAMITAAPPDDALLITLLWQSGARISEALGLRPESIRGNDLRVLGKGKKERLIPVPVDLINALLRRSVERTGPGRLFPITRSAADKLVKRAAARAGITRPVHCHLFRHGYAVNVLRQTGNIAYVQKLLGHADIETTMIYARAAMPDVREALKGVQF